MYCYFFSGAHYIRVQRGETGAGTIDSGYPAPISNWQWPAGFGADGIDAALYSGSVCYFFKGAQYIQVTRGITGAGNPSETIGPSPISDWGWHGGFGAEGIDAALWSGPVSYFFKGNEYIRVTRNSDTDKGTTDPGYPKTIQGGWGWTAPFSNGVKGALPSGSKCYFFSGKEYIRVSRGYELAGFVDSGYPAPISGWQWGADFGAGGIDAALYSGGPLEPPPSAGLGSNSNYYLANGGAPLTDLSVTINIDSDIVSTTNGFGFQLNGYSAPANLSAQPAAQQYIVFLEQGSTTLKAWIYNQLSPPAGTNIYPELLQGVVDLVTLPIATTIKTGSSVTITPAIDGRANITGCEYTYVDPTGKSTSVTIDINELVVGTTNQLATEANMAPITTYTLDIVADYSTNSASPGNATITGGQGTITYSAPTASTTLTALSTEPSFAPSAHTLETSNFLYAELPPSVNVSQLFGMAPPGWVKPQLRNVRFLPAKSPPRPLPQQPTLSGPRPPVQTSVSTSGTGKKEADKL